MSIDEEREIVARVLAGDKAPSARFLESSLRLAWLSRDKRAIAGMPSAVATWCVFRMTCWWACRPAESDYWDWTRQSIRCPGGVPAKGAW